MELDMTLSDRQLEILEACQIGNGIEVVLACTGRQVGKTTTAQVVAYDWCVSHSNFRVGFVMPTYGFCRKVWKDLKAALDPLIRTNIVVFLGSPLTITFSNGSEIRFYTAENETARGESFDGLIVDEACMITDYIWGAVIKPTINAALAEILDNGNPLGKILVVSTPKKRNFFFNLLSDPDPTFYKVRFTTEEGGRCPVKEIEKARLSLPPDAFRNEYMGEFSDGNGLVFNFKDCVRDNHIVIHNKKGSVAALDIGGKVDATVLTIQNKAGDVILQKGWVRDWTELLPTIITHLKQYGSPDCYVETNGVGETPYTQLKWSYPNTREWRTTAKSKAAIVEKLVYDFNTGNLTIPRDEELLDELSIFEMKEQSGQYRKYGHPSGKHDDKVMSLAICNYNRGMIKTVKPTMISTRRKRSV